MATNNSINTPVISLSGAFTMTGGTSTFVGTLTGNTTVTFPLTGTLLSSATYPVAGATSGKIIISDGTNWIASTSIFPNTVGTALHLLLSDGTSNVYSTPAYPNAAVTAGKVIISDGTNYIASTSIWPNTVGTAAKLVISDGTSNVYSTPTWPTTGGTSGSVVISDGTNKINSTSLWPNTVGTSGKIVISNGTSNVYSTPTFPNASATSGSIIISDGTNFISSTSLWPNTVGTAGKIVRSDGTVNAYTTSTFADTYAINTLLYNASANTVSGLATANSGVLITSAGGVPSISSTLPAGLTITTPVFSGVPTGTLTSGTYTPTLSNIANVSASTANLCQYLRVGNVVTVSGSCAVDAVTTLTTTQIRISLPIASVFTNTVQAGGVLASQINGAAGSIQSENTSGTVQCQWQPVSTSNDTYGFTFTYQVI